MGFLSLQSMQERLTGWLRQGISPRRLALTLAAGFILGCFPILGITTVLCLLLAMAFRLNPVAMQAANYAAMPLQLALIWPFVQFGQRILPAHFRHTTVPPSLHAAPMAIAEAFGSAAEAAVLAWMLFALPAAVLLTLLLMPVLRRIPAVAAAESGS